MTSSLFIDKAGYYKPIRFIDDFLNGDSELESFSRIYGDIYAFLSAKLRAIDDMLSLFQYYRMLLGVLSDYLNIPLNKGNVCRGDRNPEISG